MKLIFQFKKTDDMIYISHLDLMRLFLRVLRMSGLRPAYSQGFNPHPKMSIALPLALGLHSACELLEFETESRLSIEKTKTALSAVNERLPEGIRVTEWCEKPEAVKKPLASYVAAASYEFMCGGVLDGPSKLADFFAKKSVIARKRDKKTNTEIDKEIRRQMLSYRIIKNIEGSILTEATLQAEPAQSLGPLVFWKAFCEASGLAFEELSPFITRTAILGVDGRAVKDKLTQMKTLD